MKETFGKRRIRYAALVLAVAMASLWFTTATYAQSTQTAAPAAAILSESTIKALQEALNGQGIAVRTDGALNDETRNAIRKYQSQHHLLVTGEPDKATLDKLGVVAQFGAAPGSASTVGQAQQVPAQPGQGSGGMMSGPMMQGMMQGMMQTMQGMMGMMQGQMQPGQMQPGQMQPGMQRGPKQVPQGSAAMNCPMMSASDQASMMQMMQGMMQMMQMMQNQMQSGQKPQGG